MKSGLTCFKIQITSSADMHLPICVKKTETSFISLLMPIPKLWIVIFFIFFYSNHHAAYLLCFFEVSLTRTMLTSLNFLLNFEQPESLAS